MSSNSAWASRAWSKGCFLSSAANRSVSGEVASYWNRPVSVTTPAYKHAADEAGMSPLIRCISRYTISAVEEASGSITGIVPGPSFDT